MSGKLVVSLDSQGRWGAEDCSVSVRVRPSEGRTAERCVRVRQPEEVPVDTGTVTVNAVFPSGKTITQTIWVAEGETVHLKLEMPRSPHETMEWLSIARDPEQGRYYARPAALRSQRKLRTTAPPALSDNSEVSALSETKIEFVVGVGSGEQRQPQPAPIDIVAQQTYPEARVLHLLDQRSQDALRISNGSQLAMMVLSSPRLPGTVRVCSLPGPWGGSADQVHVALRPTADDILPDVQLVMKNAELAVLTGFLERRDQQALSIMHNRIVDLAVQFMEEKSGNPIGAAIGLASLLRLGDLERVKGWSRNLWHWFPGLPDGGALHASVLLREPEETTAWQDEFRAAVSMAATAGLPLLVDSLRRLREALSVLSDLDEGAAQTPRRTRWCDRMLRAADPDALFVTVTVEEADLPVAVGASRG
jgi:hypothetical protein